MSDQEKKDIHSTAKEVRRENPVKTNTHAVYGDSVKADESKIEENSNPKDV